jgi:hypothetical protein
MSLSQIITDWKRYIMFTTGCEALFHTQRQGSSRLAVPNRKFTNRAIPLDRSLK